MRKQMTGRTAVGVLAALVLGAGIIAVARAAVRDESTDRAAARKAFDAGNFKDAYDAYHDLLLDAKSDPMRVGEDLNLAIQSLQRLGRVDEVDALREKVVEVHKANWRLLRAAAQSFQQTEQWGFVVAGQ